MAADGETDPRERERRDDSPLAVPGSVGHRHRSTLRCSAVSNASVVSVTSNASVVSIASNASVVSIASSVRRTRRR
ncbi:hypothetical protein GS429_16630 [Natronorubrum sp. JWXQ-INN-674]|uniref:Uncharacterized protein n=1 Tax=Natronorubrum halalkaliphilum TaxID=2691917 RepID=A0A6B0VQR0_9EURY|nr:hypothetical protein [Natronorubrum halalkaliphilum]